MLQLEVSGHTFQEGESGPTWYMKIDYDDNPGGNRMNNLIDEAYLNTWQE